jgi:hypothetical protein
MTTNAGNTELVKNARLEKRTLAVIQRGPNSPTPISIQKRDSDHVAATPKTLELIVLQWEIVELLNS